MNKVMVFAAAAMAMSTATPSMAAQIVGLYNTGVNATGTKITVDNQVDTHYLVNGAPSYTTSNPAYLSSSTASFISALPNGQGGSANYTLSFLLAGLDPTTATLSGDVAYDNGLTIFLNGVQLFSDVPASPGNVSTFSTLHRFTAPSSAFRAGANTLTFAVVDYGQPTGLLVTNLTGTALTAVPEPATWGMMLLGFGGMGLMLRRRARVSTRIRFA